MNKCVECGKPARLALGAEDVYTDTCSNECSIAAFNREYEAGNVVCVGELTPSKIHEALSSGGWTVPGGDA